LERYLVNSTLGKVDNCMWCEKLKNIKRQIGQNFFDVCMKY
jgi:hypothetical protein